MMGRRTGIEATSSGKSLKRSAIVIACLVLASACAPSIFPYRALDGVNHRFDFSQWQTPPDQSPQQKIQVGGRILQAEVKEDTVTIVAAQLPIPKDPTNGPEAGKPGGEFIILYKAILDPLALRPGNTLMAVGDTGPPALTEVGNRVRQLPTLTALCIHFWNAGGKEIVLRGSSSSGTKTLADLTYCRTAL